MDRSRTYSQSETSASATPPDTTAGLRIEIQGAVQGVGFRPFVYRLADELQLAGWVVNDSRGVQITVEGPCESVEMFRQRVEREAPPRSRILRFQAASIEPSGCNGFAIRKSEDLGIKTVVMLPEVATCADCKREVFDSGDRRHRYPFTNCTNCGPRFTIIEDLPYDRDNTTMRTFRMCPDCQREYDDPYDRRYHAQPNACPVCGPRLELVEPDGARAAGDDEAVEIAASAIRDGRIVAVKGLGGFHLMVDACSDRAVTRLRRRKSRYEKPLALMVRDLEQAAELCAGTPEEIGWLTSPEAPIVLLAQKSETTISAAVAPGNPRLGLMLPYSPLHHLLLERLDSPLVATSGNLSDEPICFENREAIERLSGIADLFLLHDRPIRRHCDDSVIHFVAGVPQPIRRARGLAPMPLILKREVPEILAVGAHLKNVVALSKSDRVFLSQHIGDMETIEARAAFESVVDDFIEMYEARPAAIAHDLHPDYATTLWAEEHATDLLGESTLPNPGLVGVQHHHAHLASCLADNETTGPCLGVIWDGTGFGSDGSIWGGEFLLGDASGFERCARLRTFALPGGDAAVREPRRSALALAWEIWGEGALERSKVPAIKAFSDPEAKLIGSMLKQGINCPRTSSIGRLFDAVAALVNLRQEAAFEGQAAMMLEFVASQNEESSYPIDLVTQPLDGYDDTTDGILEIDWEPTVRRLVEDVRGNIGVDVIAARFHNTLVDAIENVAVAIGMPQIALSGGCFQNRRLTERTARRLRARGFEVLMHRQVPCNDGGISLGQVSVAAARLQQMDT